MNKDSSHHGQRVCVSCPRHHVACCLANSKLNSTGASGYIGGQVLHDTVRAFPDHKITILERHEEKAAKVKAAYPKVNVVIGGLDDAEVVEREASNADVVLSTNTASLAFNLLLTRI